jgi:hypothetical protein
VPRAPPQSSFRRTWKDTALSGLPSLCKREEQRGSEQSHIAELEQLVRRQTRELEIVNKSLQAAPRDCGHLKMLPSQVGGIARFAQPKSMFPKLGAPSGENTPSEKGLQ